MKNRISEISDNLSRAGTDIVWWPDLRYHDGEEHEKGGQTNPAKDKVHSTSDASPHVKPQNINVCNDILFAVSLFVILQKFLFLATLVALHFTPVSESVSHSSELA